MRFEVVSIGRNYGRQWCRVLKSEEVKSVVFLGSVTKRSDAPWFN